MLWVTYFPEVSGLRVERLNPVMSASVLLNPLTRQGVLTKKAGRTPPRKWGAETERGCDDAAVATAWQVQEAICDPAHASSPAIADLSTS